MPRQESLMQEVRHSGQLILALHGCSLSHS